MISHGDHCKFPGPKYSVHTSNTVDPADRSAYEVIMMRIKEERAWKIRYNIQELE